MADVAPTPAGLTEQGRKVAAHWGALAVTYEGAVAALGLAGVDPAAARAEDLHGIDMIHMGGLAATDALALAAGVSPGDAALDVGCGVGGPARRLAERFGARVVGVELSERLADAARRLTALVGLGDRVTILHGSALALPVPDAAFDVVVMQHVAMQIAEKERLFAELARVLRPGGRLALHEIFGGAEPPHYPLAWATEPSMSALEPLEACLDRLARLDLAAGGFEDHGEAGLRYHQQNIARIDADLAAGVAPLGLAPDVARMRRDASVAMARNLTEGRLRVGFLTARKGRAARGSP